VLALADLFTYPLTKGSRVARSGPHGDHVLAGRAASEAPAVATMDLLHHPPSGLSGLERGLDVFLRMPTARRHPVRLRVRHDVHGHITVASMDVVFDVPLAGVAS
jgi:hypothetical protein